MSVSSTLTMKIETVETLESTTDPFVLSSAKSTTTNGLNLATTINSGTGVPATKQAFKQLAMTAGAATIDLRNLVGVNGGAQDGNGLKVQAIIFRGKSDNANPITVAYGASNGYALLGSSFTFDLKPGQMLMAFLNEAAPDINSSAKTIDISGTGSQVLEYQLVMG